MKKIVLVLMAISTLASIISCKNAKTDSCSGFFMDTSPRYVDLGLPSGTLWKNINENVFYIYNDAVKEFGDSLPSIDQWEELENIGCWIRTECGYKVVGPSGDSIFLPSKGYIPCGTDFVKDTTNLDLYYWSSNIESAKDAFVFWTNHGYYKKTTCKPMARCDKLSVRLVCNSKY